MTRREYLEAVAAAWGDWLAEQACVDAPELYARPAAAPDRSGYQRPTACTLAEAVGWLYGGVERGFMREYPAAVHHAALLLLAIREQVTGVRLS